LLDKFKQSLGGGTITNEHRDYILIKELYHCKPSDLDNEPERLLQFHFNCLMAERKHEAMQIKKEEQQQQVKKLLSK
jgi:hypothetical protein